MTADGGCWVVACSERLRCNNGQISADGLDFFAEEVVETFAEYVMRWEAAWCMVSGEVNRPST